MSKLVWFPLIIFVGGCASVRPRERFPEVEKAVADRSAMNIHWNTGGPADVEVAARVKAMLAAPLDADAAAQIALLNNHHLQAAYEDLGVAQADLIASGLLKNPRFDGSFRFVEAGASPTIDLDVAFDFLDVFFIGLRKRVAEAQFDVVKSQLTSQVIGTAAEVKSAFYTLQAATQAVELRAQIEQATAASATFAERLRAAGNNRPLDVAMEQSLHEEAKLSLDAATAEAAIARERLGRLMGVAADVHWSLGGHLPDVPDEGPLVNVEQTMTANSLALETARAQTNVELRKLGITRPFAAWSGADVGVSSERQDGRWEVGPSLGVPLPLFDQGQPAIARGEAALRQAQERYRAMEIDVASYARTAAMRVQSLHERAARYRTAVLPLKQAIVSDTQLQYNAMQVGAFQLLQAKREQISAAEEYLALLRDYWIARTDLELGLRGGAIDDAFTEGAHSHE